MEQNSTGNAILNGGGKVYFSLREKGEKHSSTACIREDKYAHLDDLLMCSSQQGKVKIYFITVCCKI